MSEGNWQRARSDEQIDQRIKEILEAAAIVFHNTPYEKVTMLMIAKQADSSRSNLYRYFKTREEIFLSLFLIDINTWVNELLKSFIPKVTIEAFVNKWTEILCKQKRLLELSPLLSLSLEKNTSEEVLKSTKLKLYEQMGKVVPVIQKALPALSEQQIMDFFLTHQALVAGAWPMGQYTELEQKVIKELALPHVIEFESMYKKAILMYLKGVLSMG